DARWLEHCTGHLLPLAADGRRAASVVPGARAVTELQLLRDEDSPKRTPRETPRDESVTTEDNRWLCGRRCASAIAPVAAILPEGETPLVFANPQGLVFELI